jgi:ABC-type multidrug transport system ATPase subunit
VAEAPDAVDLPPLQSEIRFAHVGFSFTQERPTLVDVDVTVPAGARVAFVGPTGAGKSAMVQLLLRLYDVDEGAVLLDGVDVRQATLSSLRGQIGIVLQDTFLFDASIRDNIALRTQATDEQIEAVARTAQLHEFVAGLPRGYDTRVGERGARLSGGQRQRLALARALLRDPRILVLDEATSALDPVTELRIVEQLEADASGRTTIAVTHRLTSVTTYDRIFVVLDGRIVERGTHAELLALGGTYADMWGTQTGTQEPVHLDVVGALGRLPLFRDVPPSRRAEIGRRLTERRLTAGQAVPEGDGCLYLLAEGDARVMTPGHGSPPVVLQPGDAFGLAALLGDESGARLQADGPVRLLVLDAEELAVLAVTTRQVAAALTGAGDGLAPSGGSRLATMVWQPHWYDDPDDDSAPR